MCVEDHEIEWLVDIAYALHMTRRLEYLHEFKVIIHGGHVTFGNDGNRTICGYGVLTNGIFSFQRVSYDERLKHNLISVGQLCKAGHSVEFDDEYKSIMTKYTSRCLIKSKDAEKMFPLDISLVISKPQPCVL